jgi:hypothetical protein
MIELLIFLVVMCVCIWAAKAIMAAFSIGEPIATVIYVVIVIIALVAILGQLGYGTGPVLLRR